jgi:hypothetical protein
MWFRNRLVNPMVRLLLRSPLHPLLSRSLVILKKFARSSDVITAHHGGGP